jgi:hypothetical protein
MRAVAEEESTRGKPPDLVMCSKITGQEAFDMSSPVPGSYPVPPRKKISPIVWVLLGVAGFILLVIMAVVAGGIYVASRVAANPMEAAAAVITAGNPDVEIVGSSRDNGTVTFREKSTGKTVTVNLQQLKEGRLVFTSNDEEKEVTIEAGPNGVKVESSDGKKVELGGKSQ